jgi:hypothetical protein
MNYAKPASVKELFSGQTLGWLRQRGTTAKQRDELGKKHEEELIRLGYFERRSYSYTNVDAAAFIRAVLSGPVKDPLCFFQFGQVERGVVQIVAQKDDFARIERLLAEFQENK